MEGTLLIAGLRGTASWLTCYESSKPVQERQFRLRGRGRIPDIYCIGPAFIAGNGVTEAEEVLLPAVICCMTRRTTSGSPFHPVGPL